MSETTGQLPNKLEPPGSVVVGRAKSEICADASPVLGKVCQT